MRSVRNCTVAVPGGAGFLGSHLVQHLIEDRGCKVVVIDNLVSGRREFVHPEAVFEHADITLSEHQLYLLFRKYDVRFVANYAASPYVPFSFERPLHVFMVNAVGALHVINAAQEAGCEAILQVSSAELYGGGGTHYHSFAEKAGVGPKMPPVKLDEFSPVEPHSSYGAAKAAIDALVQVRWREAGTPVIALRQFNVCGERETHPYVVPEIISQLSKARADAVHDWGVSPLTGKDGPYALTVRLGNNSFRDFQYAGDAVRMATELLERGEFGQVYNMGSQEGVKIYDLARMIGRVMGFADVKVEEDASRKRPWEIWFLLSDNSKLYSVIEARPAVGLEEALRRTVAWFEGNGRRWPWQR